jgi:4-diphosphocytidyl-2-C-methyl-D-erythritol kinase
VKSLNLTSYAKLNLYLEVLGKRPDNYHSIFTIFERISLSDQIRLRPLPQGEIKIALSGCSLSLSRRNLAYQAAILLKRGFQIREGVQIDIRKHIPVSSGLGGGSSNAATVLTGLNQLWKLNLGIRQLVSLGRQIGSDVPFFLHNCSFASATDRGDEIRVLKLPVKLWHIIVVPRVKVRSPLIYKRWDGLTKKAAGLTPLEISNSLIGKGKSLTGLTTRQSKVKILRSALSKKDFSKIGNLLFNSLEQITTTIHPVIKRIKLALSDLGLQATSMSGSGSAVFGLVSSRKEAYAVVRKLAANLQNWDVFVARTI